MKASLDDELYEALIGDMTPKFLATKDAEGIPNVVPIISIRPYSRQKLIFGNFLMWKTQTNLMTCPQVGVAVFTETLFGASILGLFEGFQTSGEYVDIINASPLLRYNAYMGVRSAGAIAVHDISARFRLTKAQMLTWNLRARLKTGWGRRFTKGRNMLHPVMAEKFSRIAAVKVISFVDDHGYPYALPVVALQPVARDVLVVSKGPVATYLSALKPKAVVAACVITTEPVAFQVKGTYEPINENWGIITISASYHASPPYVGKQIV